MVIVETKTVRYNNANIEDVETHTFPIRISPAILAFNIGQNYSVQFKGKYYIVIGVEDFNEEGRFLGITTVERGLLEEKVNW
jgi:hypothetical protein